MEQVLQFMIEPLLVKNKEGHVTGPMSSFLFAKEMAAALEIKFNRLARVWLEDEEIHQYYEDERLTAHDTLIIGCQYQNDLWLSLWINVGVGGLSPAMCYQSDRKVILTPAYASAFFEKKLTETQIQQIFDYAFSHPDCLSVIQSKD